MEPKSCSQVWHSEGIQWICSHSLWSLLWHCHLQRRINGEPQPHRRGWRHLQPSLTNRNLELMRGTHWSTTAPTVKAAAPSSLAFGLRACPWFQWHHSEVVELEPSKKASTERPSNADSTNDHHTFETSAQITTFSSHKSQTQGVWKKDIYIS